MLKKKGVSKIEKEYNAISKTPEPELETIKEERKSQKEGNKIRSRNVVRVGEGKVYLTQARPQNLEY